MTLPGTISGLSFLDRQPVLQVELLSSGITAHPARARLAVIVEFFMGSPAISFGIQSTADLFPEGSGEGVIILPVHLLRYALGVMSAERSVHDIELFVYELD